MATSFSKDDFRRIRLSLAAAVVMAAAGGAIVYASLLLHQAEKKNQATAQAKRAEIQGRLMRARDEELEVKNKIARYNELSKRGVFGEEQRLDWVEQIRHIKTERKLFDIQYEIAPQQAIDAALLPGSSANFDFRSSSMQMRMKLLHEEDLLNFLADLRASAQAYLRVRRCDVDRLPKATGESRGIPPQLSADCTIDWITIREKKAAS
jgi:hypothetical protein